MTAATSVGDVIAVPLENGLHGLVQVIRVDPDCPFVLVLDFEGEVPPAAAIAKLRPLTRDPGFACARVPGWTGGSVVAQLPSKATGAVLTADEWTEQGYPAGSFVVAASWKHDDLPSMVFYGGEYSPLPPDADETTRLVHRVMREDVRKALAKRRAPKRRTSTRRAEILARLPTPPPPTDRMTASITDDDGVIVAASAAALALRYGDQAFDPAFPAALLEGINADEIAAWQTESEGEVSVTLKLAPALPPDAKPCGRVKIVGGDSLLLLPYAAYTYAASSEDGLPQRDDVVRFAVAEGTYECGVVRTSTGDLAFTLVLAPTTASRKRVRAVVRV